MHVCLRRCSYLSRISLISNDAVFQSKLTNTYAEISAPPYHHLTSIKRWIKRKPTADLAATGSSRGKVKRDETRRLSAYICSVIYLSSPTHISLFPSSSFPRSLYFLHSIPAATSFYSILSYTLGRHEHWLHVLRNLLHNTLSNLSLFR